MSSQVFSHSAFNRQLKKYYSFYTGGFILFLIALAVAEQMGMSRQWIGYWFLFATIGLYAGIGFMSRTAEIAEYYVAGRRVPAFFNGMATGADWMSAASFIGMAGTLFLSGFDGLAWVMGWTGGYCLVALFLAPYLRKFGQFTIPDFLAERYGGNIIRTIGIVAAIVCSFVYVVAQIYGVGLIMSRFTGLEFGVGVFVGLAGILVCSMLGGMRAVTWTQVAQYIILIIAYLTPVVWLGMKHTGIPVPQVAYGYTLQKVTELEKKITNDPKEQQVRKTFADRSAAGKAALADPDKAYSAGKAKDEKDLADLKASNAPAEKVAAAERAVASYPSSVAVAKSVWNREVGLAARSAGPRPHAQAFPGKDEAAQNTARLNFIGIVFCMMFGTAALPHILMRYYTTPSVQQARVSVFWSLFFIFLLYFTAPCLAVLAKYDMYTNLVGSSFASLPAWAAAWAKVDPGLLNITDINGDGIVQWAEVVIGGDLIVLATPEIAGLPYVVSGLVAAGGLAAALSTADGLLLTIANALSHDLYYKMIDPTATTTKRVTISKILLVVVAIVAAYVTSLKPGDILFLVGAAFSLAASSFFPALVVGVFWKRANKWGAIVGMIAGLSICIYYMMRTYPFFTNMGIPKMDLWFGLSPVSAGMFGLPVGVLTIFIISLLTSPPSKEVQELVEHVRYPHLKGDTVVSEAR
ncbi:MAG TPA: sodium:solute symporter family protein [Burkholderiales bacterium]|nr:sodium:solute symporter family protein [Burkholderiales bacterium]